jgi:hypothetical protein
MSYTTVPTIEWITPHGSRCILEQPTRGCEIEVWRLTQSGRGRFKVRTLQARTLAAAYVELVADGYEPVGGE